jgi:hypothetical protein
LLPQNRGSKRGHRGSDHHDKFDRHAGLHQQQQQGKPPRGPGGRSHGFYGSSLGKSYSRPGGGWRSGNQVRSLCSLDWLPFFRGNTRKPGMDQLHWS